jgi:predicted HicB family RNase H-like nuclease
MTEEFNMSMRKFLKQVGVTSQQVIEEALREKGAKPGQEFEAKVVLTVDGLDVEHVVTGTIKGQD